MQTLFKSSIYTSYLLLGIAWTQPAFDTAQAQDTAPDHSQLTGRALISSNAANIDLVSTTEEESITQLGQALWVFAPTKSEQENILKAIRQVNPAERIEVVKYTLLFLTPDMSWDDCAQIINSIKDIPVAERESFVTNVKRIANSKMTAHERVRLLDISKAVPVADHPEVFSLTARLMTSHTNFSTALQILDTVRNSSADDREAIALALPLIVQKLYKYSECLSWQDRLTIIRHIQKLPPQERQGFVKHVSFFIAPDCNLYRREKLINAIRELSPEERDSISYAGGEMLRLSSNSDAFEHALTHALTIVKYLSPANRIKAAHIATSLFSAEMDVSTREEMINILCSLPKDELEEALLSLQLLLGPTPRDSFCRDLLTLMGSVPTAELKNFILIAATIAEGMNEEERLLMASSVVKIPALEWEEVIYCAKAITPSKAKAHERAKIIQMLGRLSNSERLQAISLIQEWVRPKMTASDQFKIIEAILKLPAAEWGSVLTHAASAIEPTMNAYELLHIIEEMQLLPHNQREEILPIAKSIITSDMNAYVRAGIISKINAIPPQQREETIPYVRALMARGHIKEGIEDFFDAVTSLASEERQEIINYALPCISEGMQGQHCKRLLQAIKAVPSHERQEVINEALAVRKIQKLDSGILIEGIMSIRQQDRKEIIKLAEPFYEKMGYGYQARILWQAMADVAAENRTHVLENTCSLIGFPCDFDDFISIICYLNKLELAEQKALCEAIIGTYGKVQYATLLQCFSLVPLTAIEDLASRLKAENQDAFSLNYLCKLIRSDADFQTTVFAHWHHLFLQPNELRSKMIAENFEKKAGPRGLVINPASGGDC